MTAPSHQNVRETYKRARWVMMMSAAAAGLCFLPIQGQFLNGFVISLGGSETDAAWVMNLTGFVNVMVFLGAYLSSRWGKRFTFILFGSLRWAPWTAALFVPLLPDNFRIPVLSALVLMYGVMLHASGPPWWSMLSDCVPQKKRGRFLGLRFQISAVMVIAGVQLFGWIIDYFGKGAVRGYIVLLIIVIPIGLFDSLCHFILPRFPVDPTANRESFWKGLQYNFAAVFRSKGILAFCSVMFLFYFWAGGINPYFMSYMQKPEYLDLQMRTVSHFSSIGMVGTLLGYWIFGKTCDRLGNKLVMMIAFGARLFIGPLFFFLTKEGFSLGPLQFSINTSIIIIGCMFFIGSMFWAGVAVASSNLMMALAPKRRNEGVMAVIMFLNMMGMALAPVGANFVFNHAQPIVDMLQGISPIPFDRIKALYLVYFGVMFVLIIRTWFLQVPDERKTGPIFRQLMLPGGFRSMMIVLFADPRKNVSQKIKTVERLQKQKNPLGIEPLIVNLEDPNLKVRMQAAWALGTIADPTSREALEHKVKDRHSQIQLDAIRALGKLGDRRSLPILEKALQSENSLIRGEAALALGQYGQDKAFQILTVRFQIEELMFVRECLYDSLSHFPDPEYIAPLIDDLAMAENPLARRHLAMIAGRYIEGEDNVFYKMLSHDVADTGAGGNERIERLIKRARKLVMPVEQRKQLVTMIEHMSQMFYNNQVEKVRMEVLALYKEFGEQLPGTEGESRSMHILDLMGRCEDVIPDNQSFTLLALYAFYRLVQKEVRS